MPKIQKLVLVRQLTEAALAGERRKVCSQYNYLRLGEPSDRILLADPSSQREVQGARSTRVQARALRETVCAGPHCAHTPPKLETGGKK